MGLTNLYLANEKTFHSPVCQSDRFLLLFSFKEDLEHNIFGINLCNIVPLSFWKDNILIFKTFCCYF